MKRKLLLGLVVILCFTGCAHKDVTRDGFESFGADIFQNFIYSVSKNVILREIVSVGENLTQDEVGRVILSNRQILFTTSAYGRAQNASADRIDVSFEEVEGGVKPVLSFTFDPKDKDKRYFLAFKPEEVKLVDRQGSYGFIKRMGNVIEYNGKKYLVEYEGVDVPYLRQKLHIKIVDETRAVKGLR